MTCFLVGLCCRTALEESSGRGFLGQGEEASHSLFLYLFLSVSVSLSLCAHLSVSLFVCLCLYDSLSHPLCGSAVQGVGFANVQLSRPRSRLTLGTGSDLPGLVTLCGMSAAEWPASPAWWRNECS